MHTGIKGFVGILALCLLAFAGGSVEGNAAGHVIEVTVADLADDPETAENAKTAREKVQAKIDGADAGDVVQFPDGAFEDVGELLFSVDGGEGEGEEIVVRGNVEDRSAVVFTGKIMFNVTASNLVIEGFTFKDTKVPDRITYKRQDQDADASNDDQYVHTAPHDLAESGEAGTVTINTLYLTEAGGIGSCPSDLDKLLRNVRIRNNEFRNTEAHGVHLVDPLSFNRGRFSSGRCGSSDMVISGNVFAGIGFNGLYVDKERNIRWERNLVSAVKSYFPNRITITDNVIDGTTYAGIMLNETFGKTVVQYNEVKNVPSFGIRVKGNRVADQSDYEVVVSDNRISNTNNDPYITRTYNLYRGDDGVGDFKRATGLTDRQADEILKPEIWRVSAGANFGFGNTGAPRPVSDFADTEYDGSGNRVAATLSEIPQLHGELDGTDGDLSTKRPCGDGSKLTVWKEDGRPVVPAGTNIATATPQQTRQWDDHCYSLVRFIEPALEAAIELSQLNAETIKVENNEITGNALGLLICERSGCSFRRPFNPLGSAKAARVPTVVKGNNIYGNDNAPDIFVYINGEAVNALEGDDNELDLSGNYLGERPLVYGNVKSPGDSTLAESAFDLSETAGPRASANDRTGPALSESGDDAPVIGGGKTLTLTFDEPLDESSEPAGTAFTVMGETSGGQRVVYEVDSVDVEGMTVVLTLKGTVASGTTTITVSYDRPGSGAALVDAAGNEVASFSDKAVRVAGMTGADDGDGDSDDGNGMMPLPAGGAGDDGGCALASAGNGGIDLGTLLPFMVLAGLAFGRIEKLFLFSALRNGRLK